jgi:hypothetical protein
MFVSMLYVVVYIFWEYRMDLADMKEKFIEMPLEEKRQVLIDVLDKIKDKHKSL